MGTLLSPKLKRLSRGLAYFCPGCKALHVVHVDEPNDIGLQWDWDGNIEAPTFTPDIKILGLCHSRVTNGTITFLEDCAHELAGQTVLLPEIPTPDS